MSKSIRDIPKTKRGRPKTTGQGAGIMVRAHDEFLSSLDAWITKQKEQGLSRPEAIRRLVELGLTVRVHKPKQAPADRLARSKELASKTIDSLTAGIPHEEKATRKRRLIKGPEEFRASRVDHEQKD
jgi:hypothetical protein